MIVHILSPHKRFVHVVTQPVTIYFQWYRHWSSAISLPTGRFELNCVPVLGILCTKVFERPATSLLHGDPHRFSSRPVFPGYGQHRGAAIRTAARVTRTVRFTSGGPLTKLNGLSFPCPPLTLMSCHSSHRLDSDHPVSLGGTSPFVGEEIFEGHPQGWEP